MSVLRMLALVGFGFVFQTALAQPSLPEGPVALVTKYFPAAGREDEAQARFEKGVEVMHKLFPKINARLHRSTTDPMTLLLVETYPSKEELNRFTTTVLPEVLRLLGPRPEGLFLKEPERELYRLLTP